MSAPVSDDLYIQVGSTQFSGWQSVSVTLSCETMPNTFALTASTEFMQGWRWWERGRDRLETSTSGPTW